MLLLITGTLSTTCKFSDEQVTVRLHTHFLQPLESVSLTGRDSCQRAVASVFVEV